jgi:hypothetical protein
VQEELDLTESKAHVAGKADEQDAVEGLTRIAALATDAMRRSEEAAFFVVADGGGAKAGAAGKFTDFHEDIPKMPLDLKLTLSFSIREWDVANPFGGKP